MENNIIDSDLLKNLIKGETYYSRINWGSNKPTCIFYYKDSIRNCHYVCAPFALSEYKNFGKGDLSSYVNPNEVIEFRRATSEEIKFLHDCIAANKILNDGKIQPNLETYSTY